ncbi:MAG: hypothetical protein HY579_04960 [Nitrospinae bacterium]|nr:hypothetical protein [Nitrospinota bacterium]
MPCKDTTSRITVRLDGADRLVDFDFSKITCNKEIGGETGYKGYCAGKSVDEISRIDFADLLDRFGPENTEEQFFLYLEWDALRTALAQYRGRDEEVDAGRYQLASISYDENGAEICQVIRPPADLPKIVSCAVRARQQDAGNLSKTPNTNG